MRDLDYALALDANDDGSISWAELRGSKEVIYAYALRRLDVAWGGQPCPLQPATLMVDAHSDGHYAVLKFQANCPAVTGQLTLGYHLFFDLDPQHRGLLSLMRQQHVDTGIFSPDRQQIQFTQAADSSLWRVLANFGYEGIWHIWMGFDHLLFLLSLLLPAALVWEKPGWRLKPGVAPVFWDVLAVVSAFTLAHSLTLSLTALQYIALPSRWVESAIAASVALAALNNIYLWFVQRRVWFAFGFGLIHGMGIASVLLNMGLPGAQRLSALLGFNLGVEAGQLAIVALVLPFIVGLSRYRFYPPLAMKFGSLSIVVIALVWLAERSLDVQLNIL